MKNLLILSGAIVAGILAFTPANAGVGTAATALKFADAGAPVVTKAHYRRRHVRRKYRRHHRRYSRGYYYRPHRHYRPYRRYYRPYYGGYGYYGYRRPGVGLYFRF